MHKDQLGRTVHLKKTPERIVSLVPSQTELLAYLCLESQLVGITKFCEHPAYLKSQKTIVGGTKKVNLKKIEALRPDIILCNKEENTKQMVAQLEQIAPVWISNVISFTDNLALITSFGAMFGRQGEAQDLAQAIKERYALFADSLTPSKKQVAYLIWKDPYMAVGDNTYINSILELIGLENMFKNRNSRYPEINQDDLKDADLVLLSSEPYPFGKKHLQAFNQTINAQVALVDGSYFSWYGSRSLAAFDYFKSLQL